MEVFSSGYGRRPSLVEGFDAVRKRRFSVKSKNSDDANDLNEENKTEINPIFMLRNGSISLASPIELPSQRKSVSSTKSSEIAIQLTKVSEEEERDPDNGKAPDKVDVENESWKLVYKVSDAPPVLLTILFAMQQVLMSLPGCVVTAVLVSSSVCGENDEVLQAQLLATTIFLSGLTTLFQVTFGVRLPVFQGPTPAYVIPILALASLPEWSCPKPIKGGLNSTEELYMMGNMTMNLDGLRSQFIYPRLQKLQGSLVFAGLLHMLIGMTGLVGLLLKFVGPITVIPTLLLLGIEFYSVVTDLCDASWGISAITATIGIFLAVYLGGWAMPIPVWNKDSGWHVIRFPLQQVLAQVLMSLPGCVVTAVLVSSSVCGENDEVLQAQLLATTIFLSGLTTLFQVTFGVRLPVFQGPTPAYVIPILALASLPEWSCPKPIKGGLNSTEELYMMGNMTMNLDGLRSQFIYPRLQKLQGSLVFAGLLHMLIGMTGLVGLLLKFVGPITVIPTLLLLGIEFYSVVTDLCDASWGISAITATIGIFLAVYLGGWAMPIPVWNKDSGWHVIRFPLQQVLAILLSMIIGWSVSGIMTSAGVFSNDPSSPEYKARADYGIPTINKTPWFFIPYPGQFGSINFDAGVFIAFVTATLTSIIDSIADYYACAKMCHVPPPPVHAVNRGITCEGFMSMIAGFFGAGHATTTYGGNIGTIGMTKVASRRVYQVFAVILIVFSVLGKFTAVFVTIPDPVIGGVAVVGFGTFLGLVMSNLQYIDLNSARNLAVIGISLLIGLMIPNWTKKHPDSISTGSSDFDNLLRTILTNPMIGGFLAFFLDNTIPGSKLERGLAEWDTTFSCEVEEESTADYEEDETVYEIEAISKRIRHIKWLKYIPILPNFDPSVLECKCCTCCACKKKNFDL